VRESLRRLAPLVALAALTSAYVGARPTLLQSVWRLDILEYPLGLLVAAPLLWLAARPPRDARARKPAPAAPWRKHRQVVVPLPDPETAASEALLRAWLQDGREAERVAALLGGRRAGADADVRAATTRRRREAVLRRLMSSSRPAMET
jgi:hypothetical protein